MAEVISVDALSPSDSAATRTGRHSRYTAEEDFVLLRELSAANSHVAALGENGKRYGEAASNFKAIPQLCSINTPNGGRCMISLVRTRSVLETGEARPANDTDARARVA